MSSLNMQGNRMVDVVINKVEIEQKRCNVVVGVSTTCGSSIVCTIPRLQTSIDPCELTAALRAAHRILAKAMDRDNSRSRSRSPPSLSMPPTPEHELAGARSPSSSSFTMPPTPEHVIAEHTRLKHESRAGAPSSEPVATFGDTSNPSGGADHSPHTPPEPY